MSEHLPTKDAVNVALSRILRHKLFSKEPHLAKVLSCLVERALAGEVKRPDVQAICTSIYGEARTCDQQMIEALNNDVAQIAKKLKQFYFSNGAKDSVVIDFSQNNYIPSLNMRTTQQASGNVLFEDKMLSVVRKLRLVMAATLAIMVMVSGVLDYFFS